MIQFKGDIISNLDRYIGEILENKSINGVNY